MKKLTTLVAVLSVFLLSIFPGASAQTGKAVKKIALSDKKIELTLGAQAGEKQLSATLSPSDAACRTVVWSTSDETVATVDQSGLVRAVSAGKAKITAAPADERTKLSATCAVTVGKAVESITVDKPSLTLDKGKKAKLAAEVLPADALNTKLMWASSNENVIRVDAKGGLIAKGTGTATITCTASDGSGTSAQCGVTVVQKVTKLTPKTKKLVAFQQDTPQTSVKVSPSDATNQKLVWSSANPSIAAVDESGRITAKLAGETTITAAATDGSDKKCTFKLIVEPCVPISIDSMSRGIYLPNLLGMEVRNACKTLTVTNFDFEMKMYTYSGDLIDSGTYSLGKGAKIGPRKSKTIKRTMMGAGYAKKIQLTVVGVQFSDGTYYTIPYAEQETGTYSW